MSKPRSGHFENTAGAKLAQYTIASRLNDTNLSESDIIASRVKGLDLREHPTKYRQLSAKKMAQLRSKAQARTMTRLEYKIYDSNRRLSRRRDQGKLEFWNQEKTRIQNGLPASRKWTPQQMHDIVHDRRPTHNGKTLQAHHTFSVSRYPHLANRGEVIFPATFREHLYGWHGGNFKNSLPGTPINQNILHTKAKRKQNPEAFI